MIPSNSMLRYKLRTLLMVLALGPPVLAGGWWKYAEWKAERERETLRRGRGTWATTRGPEPPPGTVEILIEQNSYDSGWQTDRPHETIVPPK
jgi:hypothetical protein